MKLTLCEIMLFRSRSLVVLPAPCESTPTSCRVRVSESLNIAVTACHFSFGFFVVDSPNLTLPESEAVQMKHQQSTSTRQKTDAN